MNFKNINFRKKIGMRTIKTSIAVLIGLYLSMLLKLDTPIFTSIAAISSMKSSFSESMVDVKKRAFTAVFGVSLGYILSLIPSNIYLTPIIGSIGIIIVIYILQVFNVKDMTVLSCIVFIASFSSEYNKLIYGFNRIVGTFLGIFISIAINYLISSPNIYEDFIFISRKTLISAKDFMIQLIMSSNHSMEEFEKLFSETKKNYNLLISESNTFIRTDFDMDKAEEIMNYFEEISFRFNVLDYVKSRPEITESNLTTIEDVYQLEFFENGSLKGDINNVYNYHIKKILFNIKELERIIGED